jgi:hypothetical protein
MDSGAMELCGFCLLVCILWIQYFPKSQYDLGIMGSISVREFVTTETTLYQSSR